MIVLRQTVQRFYHIDDVIDVIVKSLSSSKSRGEIFNIGTGKPKKIKMLLIILPKAGQTYFWKNKFRKDEISKIYPDISKAKKVLKWYPKTILIKHCLNNRYYKRN